MALRCPSVPVRFPFLGKVTEAQRGWVAQVECGRWDSHTCVAWVPFLSTLPTAPTVFSIYDSPGFSPWLLHLLCLPVLSRVCSPTHPLIHLVHVSRTPAMCQTTVLGAGNVV